MNSNRLTIMKTVGLAAFSVQTVGVEQRKQEQYKVEVPKNHHDYLYLGALGGESRPKRQF
jgi:hypothetical protein